MEKLRTIENEDFFQAALPKLEKLESLRRVKFATYKIRKKWGITLATILTPVCGWLDWLLIRMQSGDDGAAGVTVFFLGALYWWVTQPKRQYALAYKKNILPGIARLFGDFSYKADGKIPIEVLKSSGIVPAHNRYESEDYFTGSYKGITINLSEIHLERRSSNGKQTTYVSVFKGLAILIDMPRQKFHGHTVLMQDVNGWGKWFQEMYLNLDHANLVDPEFEKAFDVYTNDQVEARYLIDPSMIENLKDMRDIYKAQTFSAAYYDHRVLVLLPSKYNYFEPAEIDVPATNPDAIVRMKEELGRVLDLVDYLQVYEPSHQIPEGNKI